MRPNILFIHSNGIVPTAGGISRTTANLVALFREKGHSVWMMGVRNKHPQAIYDKQQSFLPEGSRADAPENLSFMKQFLRSNDIEIVVNQTPFATDIVQLLAHCKAKCGVKVVSCYHNSILTPVYNYAYQQELRLRQRHLSGLFWLLKQKLMNDLLVKAYIAKYRKAFLKTSTHSDAIVLLCDGQVEEWKRMTGMSEPNNVSVIPNYMPSIADEGENHKKNHVLWVGTFDYNVKRPDLILQIWQRVWKKHQDWHLFMLGDGPSLNLMKQQVLNQKIGNVTFTGRVTPTDYYKSAKIQCVTSVHEAFPMVIIEGMQSNIPVISFESFTSSSLIINNTENGFLIHPFNIDSYTSTLEKLMEDEELRSSMGKKAKASVGRFSPCTVYSLWQQLFEKLWNH